MDLLGGEGPSDPPVPVSGSFMEEVSESKHKVAGVILVGIVADNNVRKLLHVSGVVG